MKMRPKPANPTCSCLILFALVLSGLVSSEVRCEPSHPTLPSALQEVLNRSLSSIQRINFQADRTLTEGLNTPTPELGSAVEELRNILETDPSVLEKVGNDRGLKAWHTQTLTHLYHVSYEFSIRDVHTYPHEMALKGPYPLRPTILALEKARDFVEVLFSGRVGDPDAKSVAVDLELEKKYLAEQKTFVQRILNDSFAVYRELIHRLRVKGLNAPFDQFAPIVGYLKLKLQTDEVVRIETQNSTYLHEFRTRVLAQLQKLEDQQFGYLETLEGIQRCLEFLDVIHRAHDPAHSPQLYHSGRYEYYIHYLIDQAPEHILMPTIVSLGATDILRARGVPIGFAGVTTDITWVDGHYQTPFEFFVHDINHTRRIWQFFKEYAEANGLSIEEFAEASDRLLKTEILPLISIQPGDSERTKNLKRLRKIILFEILHEDALPAAIDVIERAMYRSPNTITPFEQIEDGNRRVTYVMEPGATTLAYVFRKLAHDFYDQPSERINYIVSPEYRTQENITEAAVDICRALGIEVNHERLSHLTNTDDGFPADFRRTLERDIQQRSEATLPLVNAQRVVSRFFSSLIRAPLKTLRDIVPDLSKAWQIIGISRAREGLAIQIRLPIIGFDDPIDYTLIVPSEELAIDRSVGTVDQVKGLKRVALVETSTQTNIKDFQIKVLNELSSSHFWIVIRDTDPHAAELLEAAQESGFETILLGREDAPARSFSILPTNYVMTQSEEHLNTIWEELIKGDEENPARHVRLDLRRNQNLEIYSRLARGVEAARRRSEQTIREVFSSRKVEYVSEVDLDALVFKGRVPLLFSGASAKSWAQISPDNQMAVVGVVEEALRVLDPNRVVIVTGGTDYGVEKIVHHVAKQKGFTVLGTFAEIGAGQEVASIDFGTVSSISWFGKSRPVLEMVKGHHGLAVFIGGGAMVEGEIHMAARLEVPFLLMNGPEGASTDASQIFPERSFSTAAELVDRILESSAMVSDGELIANDSCEAALTRGP